MGNIFVISIFLIIVGFINFNYLNVLFNIFMYGFWFCGLILKFFLRYFVKLGKRWFIISGFYWLFLLLFLCSICF